MSKRQLLALLGFWVIIFLFLGIPIGWDKWVVAPVTGVLIIIVAYKKTSNRKPSANSVFAESNSHVDPVQAAPASTSNSSNNPDKNPQGQ